MKGTVERLFVQTTPSILSKCTRKLNSTLALLDLPIPPATEINRSHLIKSVRNQTHLSQILTQIIVTKTPIDQFSLMNFIDILVSSKGYAFVTPLFTQFQDFIDFEICLSIIRAFTGSRKHLHSICVYAQMQKLGLFLNSSLFPIVLKSVAQLCFKNLGKCTHCNVIRRRFDPDVYTSTALVHMYCVCFLLSDGHRVFDEMAERNSVSWNALISGYVHNRRFREAIDLFRKMQADGMEPGEVTVVSVLSACAHLGALNQGKWIHDYIAHKGLQLNVFVGTALIDLYAKCGFIDEAERVFGAMRAKNVYAWNVMISGYAMNGRAEAALKTFDRMVLEGFRPDEVTFLGILCACCHQGLVDEGKRRFMSMKEEYRLYPRIEHYGCMVDLLGRAGYLDDAMEMIRTMHMKPDPIIWRSMLDACRIHGHSELGEFASKKLLELEPRNGENYVLLSNLYVRDQRWVEVGKLRELMDSVGIRKVPGCSSIEIDDVIHEFKASDSIEPVYKEVHMVLADMKKRLTVAGYAVDTDMGLYDIEVEEKEHNLLYHSEKLALAFGILKSSDTTLRIIKNLRICQDCHIFFKLVSLIYKRNIIVRDRNRFHHFVGGVCSCKDYW